MGQIVKKNIAHALNSLSGVLGTADQIQSSIYERTGSSSTDTGTITLQAIVKHFFEINNDKGYVDFMHEIVPREALDGNLASGIPIGLSVYYNNDENKFEIEVSLNDIQNGLLFIIAVQDVPEKPSYIPFTDLYKIVNVNFSTLAATVENGNGARISVELSGVSIDDLFDNPDTRYKVPVTFSKVSILQDGEVTKDKLADDVVEKTSLEIYNLPHNTIPNVESTSSLYEVITAFSKLKLHVGNIDAVCVGSIFSSDNTKLVVFIKILTKDASGNWPYSTDYLQSDGSIIVPAVITIPQGSTAWELTYECAGITMQGGDVIKSVYTESNTRTIINTALTVNETALKNAYKS